MPFNDLVDRFIRAQPMIVASSLSYDWPPGSFSSLHSKFAVWRTDLRRHISGAGESSWSSGPALTTCKEILEWGRVYNPVKGAWPILKRWEGKQWKSVSGISSVDLSEGSIETYLNPPCFLGMTESLEANSGLTKIYAAVSESGLPIYDSRVALSSALIAEKVLNAANAAVPIKNRFSTGGGKGNNPRRLPRVTPCLSSSNPSGWHRSQVRLGYVLHKVVENKHPDLGHKAPSFLMEMHRLEAGLFMLGASEDHCLQMIAHHGL